MKVETVCIEPLPLDTNYPNGITMTIDEAYEFAQTFGYNMIRHRSNGYSLSWVEIVPVTKELLATKTEVLVQFTKQPIGEVKGTREVSFS